MKRIALLALLALALPVAAFAGSVDLSNTGGTLAGTSAGLTLSGSTLTQVVGFNGAGSIIQGGLGTLSFSTGSLTSGTLNGGGTFNGGGSFVITSNGFGGLPNGTLFTGSFIGTVYWDQAPCTSGAGICYSLRGSISGTWYNGTTVNGATIQITFPSSGKTGFNGSIPLGSGDTIITTVPEPGTLGLLGTGLVGLAGIVRKKLMA